MKRVVTRIRAGGTEIDEWTLRAIYTETVVGSVESARLKYCWYGMPGLDVANMNIVDIEYKEVEHAKNDYI